MPRTECKHCGLLRTIQGRGLCKKCWSVPKIKNKYRPSPLGRPLSSFSSDVLIKRKECKHCREIKIIARRELCYYCWRQEDIREIYEGGRYYNKSSHSRMTDKQLDEIIEQQMGCLPRWWYKEVNKQRIEVKPRSLTKDR